VLCNHKLKCDMLWKGKCTFWHSKQELQYVSDYKAWDNYPPSHNWY
jgi:hypothetical protein